MKLKSLKTLILENNPIDEIPPNISLPYLQKLEIAKTNIKVIDLSKFPSLKELWITDKRDLDFLKFLNVSKPFKATTGRLFSVMVEPNSTKINEENKKKKWWKF